jgi:hypothetical protein
LTLETSLTDPDLADIEEMTAYAPYSAAMRIGQGCV